jgi:hypothetical protein
MRIFKIILIITVLLALVYSAAMYFVVDSKELVLEKEIQYPVDKVYPQFSNLQNFTSWNEYFTQQKGVEIDYYSPYEGLGSSLSYNHGKNSDEKGELFLRYANPNKSIRYQLFVSENEAPYLIDIKFIPKTTTSTRIIWKIHTPKQSFFKRSFNLFIDNFTEDNIGKSMHQLKLVLENRVVKDQQLANIKMDTIMREKLPAQILLGVSVNSSNKKDALFKNLMMNHNKVSNYVKMDLGKKEEEYGLPMMLTEPSEYKNKEISYFYGIPIAKKMGVSDNSLSFRTMNESQALVYYYKGSFEGRMRPIQLLLQKAKKDTMKNGMVIESFVNEPKDSKECFMKIILPIYR